MREKECLKCYKMIDLDKELHVNIKTNRGKKNIEDVYFHLDCWKTYCDEKAREKAQAVIKRMQEQMRPLASLIIERVRGLQ